MSDTQANQTSSGGADYEELMKQSRSLASQGDEAGARQSRARQAIDDQEQMSFGQSTKEFFFGDNDPTTQNLGEKIGSALNKAGESLTFGMIGDETSAAVESVLPGVEYETRRDHYRRQEDQFTQDHPLVAIIAELAPLAIPGVGAAAAGGKGAGLAARMARGGAVAGAQGATYGFTEGEGGLEQRLEDAGTGAALSAGIGMAMPVAARSIQRSLDRRANSRAVRQMVREAPPNEQLKSAASGRYTAGRARGSLASPGDAQSLVDDVTATLKREGVMRANGDLITGLKCLKLSRCVRSTRSKQGLRTHA